MPKVTSYDEPHSSVIVEFPNGVTVMVCDATGEDSEESVSVTATGPAGEKVRFHTLSDPEAVPA